MRARYSAFALARSIFFWTPSRLNRVMTLTVRRWRIVSQSQWQGLDIISAEQGQAGDKQGFVEFVAHFVMDGETRAHRERSLFRLDEATDAGISSRRPTVNRRRSSRATSPAATTLAPAVRKEI